MPTTYDVLLTRYMGVARLSRGSDVPAATIAQIHGYDQTLDFAAATRSVIGLAHGTTDVALMTYQFFTGATPSAAGLDYLIAPTGPNPNNLNSAYYQTFSDVNRFINFAVNLGKGGEGRAFFEAAYGSLSLTAALTRAYTDIFGHTPASGKADAILNAQVSNGLGGVYTRTEYFASYGLDGLGGLGTKAAMIGWLLAESLKGEGDAQVIYGPYATATQNFMRDMIDGTAQYHDNMLADYGVGGAYAPDGALSSGPPGVAITVAHDGNVRAPAGVGVTGYATAGFSTDGNDTISAPSGLDAGRVIVADDGNDVITVGGVMAGSILAGHGNDSVTVQEAIGVVDGGEGNDVLVTNKGGTLLGGIGDDQLTSNGDGAAVLDGGAGNDVLFGGGSGANTLRGGDGADTITAAGAASQTIDGGAGADAIIIYGSASAGTITTGAGADFITLRMPGSLAGPITITDFQAGAGGDRIDLIDAWSTNSIVDMLVRTGTWVDVFYGQPFGAGALRVRQVGADTDLEWRNSNSATGWTALFHLQNVTASALTDDNFWLGWHPNGSAPKPQNIVGTNGNDTLIGLSNDDVISGLAGNDTIVGKIGADTLTGGAGSDTFSMPTRFEVGDTITDFATHSSGAVDADYLQFGFKGNFGVTLVSGASPVATSTLDTFLYHTDDGRLFYDPDGTGATAPFLVVTLQGHPNLTVADFL